MLHRSIKGSVRVSSLVFLAALAFLMLPAVPASAATTLTYEIVSWPIIGLDSNDPSGGNPEIFLVQVEVTNTGAEAATNVQATLSLASPSCGSTACVTLVSSPTYTIATIPAGGKADAFWTVRVAKVPAAFSAFDGSGNATNITTISLSVTGTNVSSATEIAQPAHTVPPLCGANGSTIPGSSLFVERLISQNRNYVISYSVSPGQQLADGSWEVVQGTDFVVTVVAHTATTYDEISVPATIDPTGVLTPSSVNFTFEQGTASDDDIYTVNAGGEVIAQYGYNASALGSIELAQLIYDCSGGSFHYNTDYLQNSITINVVPQPSQPVLTLAKSASPSPANPGQTVTFTITYTNSGVAPATNLVITDVVDPVLENVNPNNGGVYNSSNRTITWTIPTVPGLSSGSVSFTARVSDFAGGRTISNIASGVSDQTPAVSTPAVNVPIRPTTPATGLPSWLLAVLGWASMGLGASLSSKRLEKIRL